MCRQVVTQPQAIQVPATAWPLMRITQVAAGPTHTLVALESGVVFGTGSNEMGQLGLPVSAASFARMSKVHQALAGYCESGKGETDPWGRGGGGGETDEEIWARLRSAVQHGDDDPEVRAARGGGGKLGGGGGEWGGGGGVKRTVGVKDSHALVQRMMQVQNGVRYPGPDLSEPAKDAAAADVYTHLSEVHSLKAKGKVRQVSCGMDFSVVLVADSVGLQSLYVFGSNLVGQLGVGAFHPSVSVPKKLPLQGPFERLSSGGHHTLVQDSAGIIWGWGLNAHSQLGHLNLEYPICWTPLPIINTSSPNFTRATSKGGGGRGGREAGGVGGGVCVGEGGGGGIVCLEHSSVVLRAQDGALVLLGYDPLDVFEEAGVGGEGGGCGHRHAGGGWRKGGGGGGGVEEGGEGEENAEKRGDEGDGGLGGEREREGWGGGHGTHTYETEIDGVLVRFLPQPSGVCI
jgi:hypothetical protein